MHEELGKKNRTPETNENVCNYLDRTSASLTLPLNKRTDSLHDPRIKITWKAQTDKQESAAHTFVYTEEAAIKHPNDKLCIKIGL